MAWTSTADLINVIWRERGAASVAASGAASVAASVAAIVGQLVGQLVWQLVRQHLHDTVPASDSVQHCALLGGTVARHLCT